MILVGFMLACVLLLCLLYRKDPAVSCWCVATVTKAKGSASINTDMRAFQCVRLCVCVCGCGCHQILMRNSLKLVRTYGWNFMFFVFLFFLFGGIKKVSKSL